MKKCSNCRKTFPLDGFHKSRITKDGVMPICKACNSKRAIAWQRENRERRKDTRAVWAKKNRLKVKAYRAVNCAVSDGRLAKQPCEVCGAKRVWAYHPNYRQVLRVRWLCPTHATEANNRRRR